MTRKVSNIGSLLQIPNLHNTVLWFWRGGGEGGKLCTVQGACSYWRYTAIEQGSKILIPLNTVCTSDYMLMYVPIRGSSTKDKTVRMKLRASQSYKERQWQKGS